MARTKPLVLTALAAVSILAVSTAAAVADDKPVGKPSDGKPAVTVPGDATAADPSLLASHDQVFGDYVDVPAGEYRVATVACPAGEVPTGGGGQTSAFKIFITDSYPNGGSWAVGGVNTGSQTESIRATAVCTTP